MTALRSVIEILGAGGVVIGSGVTSWAASRASRRASDTTAEVGLATVDATREDKFIERLENRLAAVEAEGNAARGRVDEQRKVIYALQDRVVILERAASKDRALITDLRRFIGHLLDQWPKPGHPIGAPPPPPAGLLEEEESTQ